MIKRDDYNRLSYLINFILKNNDILSFPLYTPHKSDCQIANNCYFEI